MLLLTLGVTILDELTRLARLETDPPFLAALGAAAICCHIIRFLLPYGPKIYHFFLPQIFTEIRLLCARVSPQRNLAPASGVSLPAATILCFQDEDGR
jgi:hypothetical protein